MKKGIVLLIGFFAAVLGLGCFFFLKSRPVSIVIDEYAENQNIARKEADEARKEWENHKYERVCAESARLKEMNISDLSKRAVDILVRADSPEHIVKKAITKVGLVVEPPWHKSTKPEENVWWTIVYRKNLDENHDWWLEQHKMTRHYRLVGNPKQSVYFSIMLDEKLTAVLTNIVIYGNTKPFFQLVAADVEDPENGCEVLSLAEARKIFPETMDLDEGIYARHPCNKYALVPVMDFHAKLAMDKATECIVLLGRMGAKSVCVSRTKGEMSDVEAGAGASMYGYNAKINSALASAMKSKMELRVVFQGRSKADISPYLLENSIWHKSDARLNGILQTILSGNRPKEWSTVEEDQSDFNFDFKAAAGVLHIAEAELRAKFEKSRQTQREFHVTF